jgi:hypothetical protein
MHSCRWSLALTNAFASASLQLQALIMDFASIGWASERICRRLKHFARSQFLTNTCKLNRKNKKPKDSGRTKMKTVLNKIFALPKSLGRPKRRLAARAPAGFPYFPN